MSTDRELAAKHYGVPEDELSQEQVDLWRDHEKAAQGAPGARPAPPDGKGAPAEPPAPPAPPAGPERAPEMPRSAPIRIELDISEFEARFAGINSRLAELAARISALEDPHIPPDHPVVKFLSGLAERASEEARKLREHGK